MCPGDHAVFATARHHKLLPFPPQKTTPKKEDEEEEEEEESEEEEDEEESEEEEDEEELDEELDEEEEEEVKIVQTSQQKRVKNKISRSNKGFIAGQQDYKCNNNPNGSVF